MPAKASNTAALVIGLIFGLLALVAVIGIVAAIAIPNLLTAQQRSKQKRTMADIRSLATALEASAVDTGSYPDGSLDDIERQLSPKYIAAVPRLDGWGAPFRYDCWSSAGAACDSYAIGSAGKDGVFTRDSLQDYAGGGGTTNFDEDIVFSNGSFTQYPQGAQR
jgi:general secretion pathway protein G